jgi:hypothetical protein
VKDRQTLARRYLDPGERLGEILFGLIMVLTITLTTELALHDTGASARELLVAALGCNLAWGVIDGGMYVMGAMLERAREAKDLDAPPPPARVTRDDLMGAVACCLLVVLSVVPIVLPFLFISDHWLALRVSNGLLVALLFVAGYKWGAYVNARRWASGLLFMAVGIALVGVAIALGG